MGKAQQLRFGVRTKILLIVATVVMVAMLTNTLMSSYIVTRQQTEAHLLLANAISRILAGQLERILFLGISIDDLQGFERQCSEAVERNVDISYAFVVSTKGNILFHHQQVDGRPRPPLPEPVRQAIDQGLDKTLNPLDRSYAVIQPVIDPRGTKVADVVVGFPIAVIEEARRQLLLFTTGVDVMVYIISLVILFVALSIFVIRPLSRIVRSLEMIQPGNLSNIDKLPETGNDEPAIMIRAFNRLLQRLGDHERALVEAKEIAEKASRAKSDFLAVMSHEIRTPMHALLGMSDMLLRTPLDQTQGSYAHRIRQAARALLAVINNILDFSKIEANKLTFESIDFNLQSVIEDALDTLSSHAEEKGLKLLCNLPSEPVYLRGDPVRLLQILLNLLGNAVKFTHQGKVELKVEVETLRTTPPLPDTCLVRIDVSDTGIGIRPEALVKIFQPFIQADGSITRHYGGSGLGLAIVKRICDLMNGDLSVTSELNRGTSFVVSIPFATAVGSVAPIGSTIPRSITPREAHILLVEDDPVNQEVARAMLEDTGYKLTFAADGLQAVSSAAHQQFDLILMDCHMPECDGFKAARIIRDKGANINTPIIALTADVLQETRDHCQQVGMNDYLTKPFTQADLLEKVCQWLASPDKQKGTPPRNSRQEIMHASEDILFDPAPLDRIACLRQANERQLVKKTVDLYLSELAVSIDTLLKASRKGDSGTLRLTAHRFKSSSANVGLLALSRIAERVESAVLANHNATTIDDLIREIEKVSYSSRRALINYLENQPIAGDKHDS